MSSTCVFCDIAAGTARASMVYADERVLAFADLAPAAPGHILVIPRRHASGLADLAPDDGALVFRTGQRVAAAVRASGLPCDGLNLTLADGAAAGQTVFHVHLHVIPRTVGDPVRLSFGAGERSRPRAELDATAAAVRARLRPP